MFNYDTSELDALTSSEALSLLNSKLPITILLVVGLAYIIFFLLHLFNKNFYLFIASIKSNRGKMALLIEGIVTILSLGFVVIKGISLMYWLYVVAILLVTLPFIISDYVIQYPTQLTNVVGIAATYLLTMFISTYHYYDLVANNVEVIDYKVSYELFGFVKTLIIVSIALNVLYRLFGYIYNKEHYYNAFKSNQLISYGYSIPLFILASLIAPDNRGIVINVIIAMMVVFEILALINFIFPEFKIKKFTRNDDVVSIQRLLNPLTIGTKNTVINSKSLFFAVTPVMVNSLVIVAMLYFGGVI